MKVKHARDSLLTLLELTKGNVLYIGSFPSIVSVLDEFKGDGYTVDYASQTIKYRDSIVLFGTVRNKQDAHKYMGLELQYMYLPSGMDSKLSSWVVNKLRGNDNCLFTYDSWN